jgi:hypothetical protein
MPSAPKCNLAGGPPRRGTPSFCLKRLFEISLCV